MMDYVKRIRDLREDSDKTQTDIANYLDTSQTMYARYERFANEMPIRHLVKLCQYYNVSADYVLGFTNQRLPLPRCGKKATKTASQQNEAQSLLQKSKETDSLISQKETDPTATATEEFFMQIEAAVE